MVFCRENYYDEQYIKRLREGNLGAQTNCSLYSSERMMRTGYLERRTQVGLKSSAFAGNWYLSLVSFCGGLLLNSLNENSQGKLDLRPLTNDSTGPDCCLSGQNQKRNALFFTQIMEIRNFSFLSSSCKIQNTKIINSPLCATNDQILKFWQERLEEKCFSF